jgi:signal transduction histidine kinase
MTRFSLEALRSKLAGTGGLSPVKLSMQFHLVRYFAMAGAGIVALVIAALVWFEYEQIRFFRSVLEKQITDIDAMQAEYSRLQDSVSRDDALRIHEAANVNLARILSNTLWDKEFAPFVTRAQNVAVDQCRALPDGNDKAGQPELAEARRKCFAAVARAIVATPGFKELDAQVFGVMRKSSVFKIKVFDLRGITIYSSDHRQIGEDKAGNAGWRGAAAEGRPSSELTHRDRFSAFERVVENRDLISTYLPVMAPGGDRIVAVFEIYSDVTPSIEQIRKTSEMIRRTADNNRQKVQSEALDIMLAIDATSIKSILGVIILVMVLFGALFSIVRRADLIIRAQARERESAHQQLAQAEKMASLGQMVAGVSHQLNTPIAFTKCNAQLVSDALAKMSPAIDLTRAVTRLVRQNEGDQLVLRVGQIRANLARLEATDVDVDRLRVMLDDILEGASQMAEMVDHLRDFTRLDRAKITDADINKCLRTVLYVAKSVISNKIEIREEFGDLPPVECNPSQLNQVFMNLVNNAAHAITGRGRITVRSSVEGDRVRVDVSDTGSGIPHDVLPHIFELYYSTKPSGEGTGLGLPIAREILAEHGGDIAVDTEPGRGTTFTVTVPFRQAPIVPIAPEGAAEVR